MTPAPKTRREQADQAFVRSLGDISSPDQDDLDLIACERIKWHEAVQWADSTPAPSEQEDEEYFKRINYFVWNYCDRDQRLTAESAFAQVLCDALNNARRTQAERMIRLQNANDGLKKVVSHYFAEIERLKNDVKRYSEMSLQYMSQIQELRSLLERAKGFADLVFGYNTTNGINPKYELEWLSDYAKLTSNAAQGERDDKQAD